MHKTDKIRAQSIIKIHGKKQVYFHAGKFYLRKTDAPKDAIKIEKETNDD